MPNNFKVIIESTLADFSKQTPTMYKFFQNGENTIFLPYEFTDEGVYGVFADIEGETVEIDDGFVETEDMKYFKEIKRESIDDEIVDAMME